MLRLGPLLFSLLISTGLTAQSTAMDWTKTDCHGIDHQLFTELNEGKVIVQEYAMIPTCAGCWQAAEAIAPVIAAYEVSHPGRVKFYATGYNDAYTCPQMLDWKDDWDLTPSVFIDGAAEVSYYGGMGMPTVVVLGGGSTHGVYAIWIGFGAWLTEDLSDSIQVALDAANAVMEKQEATGIALYPSPATSTVNIELTSATRIRTIEVVDLAGHVVLQRQGNDAATAQLDVSPIPDGSYALRITTVSGELLRSLFQVIH